jgi:hypothetical protein
MTNEAPRITHRAHLRRSDLDKHGYTDRCAGCSAILRGINLQPHSPECRQRIEAELASDIRVKNAKVRMQERTTKMKADPKEQGDTGKRRKLEDIEDQAMKEEDPDKLAKLFEQYRAEYIGERNDNEEDGKRRRADESGRAVMQEKASGSQQPAAYAEMEVGNVMEGMGSLEGHSAEEYAWDDVNDMALPIDMVKKARREEMVHMKGNIYKVVKKSEAWEVTGKAPISTKWVDTDKTHGTGEPMVRSRWVARDFKNRTRRTGRTCSVLPRRSS